MSEINAELGFQLRLENIAAEPAFEEVLETAIETCIQDRSTYEVALKNLEQAEQTEPCTNQLLIQCVGSWGIRAATDFVSASGYFYSGPDEITGLPVQMDVLQNPELIPLHPNKTIQRKIEALGNALLEEAFACLGKDAPEQVDRFKTAPDANAQKEVMSWLYTRIAEIRDKAFIDARQFEINDLECSIREIARTLPQELVDSLEDMEKIIVDWRSEADVELDETAIDPGPDQSYATYQLQEEQQDETFYHPARLSPKFLGVYPETRITPTCLGVSLLAAAFIRRTGAPYLHAGVMNTSLEFSRITQLEAHDIIEVVAAEHAIVIQHNAAETLNKMTETIKEMRRNDRGHHALTLVQLKDDRWVYFDPNYRSMSPFVFETDNNDIQESYEKLEHLAKSDPSASLLIASGEGRFADAYLSLLDHVQPVPTDELTGKIDRAFDAPNTHEELTHLIFAQLLDAPNLDMAVDVLLHLNNKKPFEKWEFMQEVIDDVMKNYVYDGMEIQDVVERYHSDHAYAERRVEDLQMAPYLIAAKLLGQFAGFHVSGDYLAAPAALEVGLPAFRIGACVLSDFAIYTDNSIPLSFWAANWPSHVAVEGHLPTEDDSAAQNNLAKQMVSIIRSGVLRYFSSYGIIHRFLEQGENTGDRERAESVDS